MRRRPWHQEVALVRVPVPDETDTLEQQQRKHHLDLRQMTPSALEAERWRLMTFLVFAVRPAPWHLERLDRVEALLTPRRRSG